MTNPRLIAAVIAALVVAGCAIGRPAPETATYVIDIPPGAPASSRRPERLSLGRVRIAPEFTGRSLVFRVDEVRYVADFYQALIADPAELLGGRIAAWLDAAGPYQSVTQPDSYRGSPLVLEVVVTELYGDVRPGRQPAAVVRARFRLVDLRGITPQTRFERTIGRRIPLSTATPEALVLGYGSALLEILSELRDALDQRG